MNKEVKIILKSEEQYKSKVKKIKNSIIKLGLQEKNKKNKSNEKIKDLSNKIEEINSEINQKDGLIATLSNEIKNFEEKNELNK